MRQSIRFIDLDWHSLLRVTPLSLVCGAGLMFCQPSGPGTASPNGVSNQQPASAVQAQQRDSGAYTLRVTTREVLVDVIALQGRNQPVVDLKPEDLKVSETFVSLESPDQSPQNAPLQEPEIISNLRIIDPNPRSDSEEDSQDALKIQINCLDRSSLHYRLAFHPGPQASQSGYHRVSISTSRPGVKLLYRHRYYVGRSEPAIPSVHRTEDINQMLLQAACYHPETPPSIFLRATSIDSDQPGVLRYSVAIDADSLFFVTLERERRDAGINRFIALDYGVCNLDSRGLPINFFHAPVDKVLTSADYARALDRGFPHLLEFPSPDLTAATRVVVRDRATGNLGVVEVVYPGATERPSLQTAPPEAQTASDLKTIESWLNLDSMKDNYGHTLNFLNMRPEPDPIGSFGSIVPASHAFCGDVYELPNRPQSLPDFREYDPVASLYTSTLDVPNQIFSNLTRIPGQPPGPLPFGIDYHGVFWVTVPGVYHFLMLSDDGAILRVDDQQVVDIDGLHPAHPASGRIRLDAGRHSIEVPYFENAEGAFALELWVKPPGAKTWSLFDTNDYAPPELHTH
jgi:hypothetical protein